MSLRVERHTTELADEVYQAFISKMLEVNTLFDLSNEFAIELFTPSFEEKLQYLILKDFNHVLGKYKGTKAFFVQNEKEMMKEEIYTVLRPFTERFIEENGKIMVTAYLKQWEEVMSQMKEETINKLQQHVQNYYSMLDAPTDIEVLEENLEYLKKLTRA